MPTVFRQDGFRFFFYSDERNEPCHIHVIGHGGSAKFWTNGAVLATSINLNAVQVRKLRDIIIKNRALIEEAWNEHFNS